MSMVPECIRDFLSFSVDVTFKSTRGNGGYKTLTRTKRSWLFERSVDKPSIRMYVLLIGILRVR